MFGVDAAAQFAEVDQCRLQVQRRRRTGLDLDAAHETRAVPVLADVEPAGAGPEPADPVDALPVASGLSADGALHHHARPGNRVGLEPDADSGHRLVIDYAPPADEPARMAHALRTLRRLLWSLGCIAPPPMTRPRPMGASVHYAGTFPMRAEGGDFSTDLDGRLRAFGNVWLVDGSSFPSLPAKNLTFTLMANATRMADAAF